MSRQKIKMLWTLSPYSMNETTSVGVKLYCLNHVNSSQLNSTMIRNQNQSQSQCSLFRLTWNLFQYIGIKSSLESNCSKHHYLCEKVPSIICKTCRFTSSCTYIKSHPSSCSPLKHSTVSNDSACRYQRPDQAVWMRRLIWIFAVLICSKTFSPFNP